MAKSKRANQSRSKKTQAKKGNCFYHLCESGKKTFVSCPHCKNKFCKEHVTPRVVRLYEKKMDKVRNFHLEGSNIDREDTHPCFEFSEVYFNDLKEDAMIYSRKLDDFIRDKTRDKNKSFLPSIKPKISKPSKKSKRVSVSKNHPNSNYDVAPNLKYQDNSPDLIKILKRLWSKFSYAEISTKIIILSFAYGFFMTGSISMIIGISVEFWTAIIGFAKQMVLLNNFSYNLELLMNKLLQYLWVTILNYFVALKFVNFITGR
jgi:hypothetical protein